MTFCCSRMKMRVKLTSLLCVACLLPEFLPAQLLDNVILHFGPPESAEAA